MSDLLAATGWIGEHPATGADMAHLLLYPATDLDQGSSAKVARLADVLGLQALTVQAPPRMTRLTVDWRAGQITNHGRPVVPALPPLTPPWVTAARVQEAVVITLTSTTLTAPDLAVIDAMIATADPSALWIGLAGVTH